MRNIFLTIFLAFSMLFTTIHAADAGLEQHVTSNDLVQLDATNSMPEKSGEIVKYKWKQTKRKSDPKVHLSDKKSMTPTFIAPDVEEITKLIFSLKTKEYYACKDKEGSDKQKCKKYTSKDTVNIFVHPTNNNEDNNDDNVAGFNIDGKIIDLNSIGISGASVNIGTQTVVTDENGSYTIMNVEVASRVSIDVTHPNYMANSRIVEVRDQNITLDIILDKATTLSFSSATGGNISDNGASVELPTDGYVNSNGTAYNGSVTVKMSYSPITTVSGRATFPGTFEGIDGNDTFPIQSYGFMNVELTDTQGNLLNLAPENNATLTFPVDYNLPNLSTIALSYYDAVLGYWVEEGEAALTNYSQYVGTVSHFTSWNLKVQGPDANLTGCVEGENGLPIANVDVQFRSTNWDSFRVPTDENGTVSVYNLLAQADLTFSAFTKIGDALYYGEYPTVINLAEGENRLLPDCIVIKEQTNLPGTVTVIGTITEYDVNTNTYEPIANGTIYIYIGTSRTPVTSGISNNDGTFSITFQIVDALEYIVLSPNYSRTPFTLQANKSTYDVGTIEDN